MATNGLNFDYDEDAWCLELGFQLGRLEFAFGNQNFQDDLGNEVARVETELMEYLYSQLSSHGVDVLSSYDEFGALIGDIFRKVGGRRTSLILIGVAAFRVGLIGVSKDAESNSLMLQTARSSLQGIPDVHLPDREAFFDQMLAAKPRTAVEIANLLSRHGAGSATDAVHRGDVFIVHGHDTGSKELVARFVERLGLRPLVLHEQASSGRTVIEKFEAHSTVGFAIVLLTPDDVGAAKRDLAGGALEGTLNDRARQNVILELGYFIGKLGRDRVCALVKGAIETPSDVLGMLTVSLKDEDEGWKLALVKEMRAAGLPADLSRILE